MTARRPQHPAHPRYWPTWLAVLLLWLLARAPRPLQRLAGAVLGELLHLCARSRRRIAATNLALCFPALDAAARAALLRRNFRATGAGIVEAAMGWWSDPARLLALTEVQGMGHLAAARARGRGVLLLGAHMTTLDLAGSALGLRVPLDAVYRRQKNPVWDYVIRRGRARRLERLVERADTRGVLASLRAGHVLWYLPDQDYGARRSVFAPFFGIRAATLTATARLARISGAAVVPVAHWREADGRYVLRLGAALADYPGPDPVADAARINALVEAMVREHPEQYLWAHRRFKTRPPGEPGAYPRGG
jgi:KDO2-lipid IV(A) lauroyltransferase